MSPAPAAALRPADAVDRERLPARDDIGNLVAVYPVTRPLRTSQRPPDGHVG